MSRFFKILFLAVATIFVSACGQLLGEKKMDVISGEVFYVQRIALPKNAQLTVTLSDVSRADAPSEIISSQTYITDNKQVPLPFSLEYLADQIRPSNTYSISAKIEIDGKLQFINDTQYRVLNENKPYNDVRVQVVHVSQ